MGALQVCGYKNVGNILCADTRVGITPRSAHLRIICAHCSYPTFVNKDANQNLYLIFTTYTHIYIFFPKLLGARDPPTLGDRELSQPLSQKKMPKNDVLVQVNFHGPLSCKHKLFSQQ